MGLSVFYCSIKFYCLKAASTNNAAMKLGGAQISFKILIIFSLVMFLEVELLDHLVTLSSGRVEAVASLLVDEGITQYTLHPSQQLPVTSI